MNREQCGGCGGTDLVKFLDLGESELADAFTDNPDALKRYPLQLYVCSECFLVQLGYVVPDEEMFNGDYTFYSSASKPLTAYHRRYAHELIDRFGPGWTDPFVVEVAANDGSLLSQFDREGWQTLGIDPAGGPATKAADRGLRMIVQPFTGELAEDIKCEYGAADLVIANNVLAHVQDLHDFIGGLARLIRPHGIIVAEVQYLGDLIAGNMFDHVYHEHRYYFSLQSLQYLFRTNGLVITGARHTEPQGGSLRITAVKHGVDPYTRLTHENWLRDMSTYLSFQGRIDRVRDRLHQVFFQNPKWKVAGFGATAKSTTLLNFTGFTCDHLEYVVDTTPAKWGKQTPGSRIPIISPEQEQQRGYPDAYLLLAWNYLSSILRNSDITNPGSARWIVPIPMPVIL